MIKNLISAISLLTRLPMPNIKHSGGNNAWAYPIVGLILGVIYGAVVIATTYIPFVLPEIVLPLIIVAIMAFLTGGFHFDGLADVFDGLWGGYNKKRRLEIMADSSIGAYGTIALIIAIGLYVFILNVFDDAYMFVLALLLSSIISRGIMGIVELTNPPAKKSGLVKTQSHKLLQIVFIILFANAVLLFLTADLFPVPLAVVCIVLWGGLSLLFRQKIGGITGDCLGATQVISEIAILLTLYGMWGYHN